MRKSVTTYCTHMIIIVDRPELRGPSYAVVAAGTALRNVYTTPSFNAAVGEMERCLRGEYNTYGEHVAKVWVVAETYHGIDAYGHRVTTRRNVRLPVSRGRGETEQERMRAILKIGAARRGSLLTFKPHWAVTPPTVVMADAAGSDEMPMAAAA